jgi:hypothetical protein
MKKSSIQPIEEALEVFSIRVLLAGPGSSVWRLLGGVITS